MADWATPWATKNDKVLWHTNSGRPIEKIATTNLQVFAQVCNTERDALPSQGIGATRLPRSASAEAAPPTQIWEAKRNGDNSSQNLEAGGGWIMEDGA